MAMLQSAVTLARHIGLTNQLLNYGLVRNTVLHCISSQNRVLIPTSMGRCMYSLCRTFYKNEIVSFIEYMAGRNSGRFQPSHASWYGKERELQGISRYRNNIEPHGSSFRTENPQLTVPPYTSSFAMTLVQKTQELEELIRLAEKHNTPQTAHKIIEYAKMRSKEGDF